MIENLQESIVQKLNHRISIYEKAITRGSIQSLEEYRSICGKIFGLEEASSLIKDLIKEFVEGPQLEARRPKNESELY
jgi:hypothetical protein